jgi:hypothetical protein
MGQLSFHKGVFDHLHGTTLVDKRQVKADIRQLPQWFPGNEFTGSGAQPIHLAPPEAGGSAGKAGAFLDFNKDDRRTIAHDQIDLTGLAAPAPCGAFVLTASIVGANDVFGSKA